MITDVSFVGNRIAIGSEWMALAHPIREAFRDGGRTFVLFDPDSSPGSFANMICLGPDGRLLWEAELPETGGRDVYYHISSRKPLVINSFSSYKCELDPETGRIVGREFVK